MLNFPLVKAVLGWRGRRGETEKLYLPKTHVAYFKKSANYSFRAHRNKPDEDKPWELLSKIEVPTGSLGDSLGQRYGVLSIAFPTHKDHLTDTQAADIIGLPAHVLFAEGKYTEAGHRDLTFEGSKYLSVDPRATESPYRIRQPKTWMGTPAMIKICERALRECEGLDKKKTAAANQKLREEAIAAGKNPKDIKPVQIFRSGVKVERLVSPHPKWPVAGKKNEIYIVYNQYWTDESGKLVRNDWSYMMDMIGAGKTHEERMKIFIRAGKELHSTPITNKRVVRVLIEEIKTTKNGKASADGDFNLRGDCGQPSGEVLVRAYPVSDVVDQARYMLETVLGRKVKRGLATDKGFFILKGRAVTCTDGELRSLDGSTIIPKDVADAVTTMDNMKWLPKGHSYKPGDVVECVFIYSKNEDSMKKDEYKFNLLAYFLGHWDEESRAKIKAMFRRRFAKIAKIMLAPADNILSKINGIMGKDASDESLSIGELLAKYYLGLIAWGQQVELVQKLFAKGKSVEIKASDYPSIIFKEEWCGKKLKRGEFLASAEFIEKSLEPYNKVGKSITLARYPFVSYQSFMCMKHVGLAEYMPGRMLILHPDDAVYCQGDGDDHISALMELNSTFKPSDEIAPFIARDVEDRGYAFTQLELYFKGAVAQSGIGTTFNLMLSSLVGVQDRTRLEKTHPLYLSKEEAAEKLDTIYTVFGGALDMFAQGIKKNLVMPELIELRKLSEELIGYDPESIDENTLKYGSKVGNGMQAALIYLGKLAPKVLAPLVERLWKVDKMRWSLPKRGVVVHRKLEGANAAIRKVIDDKIMEGWIPKSKRGENFLNFEFGSEVIWQQQLTAIIENYAGMRLPEIQHKMNEEITACEAEPALIRYLDAYAYAAYKIQEKCDNIVSLEKKHAEDATKLKEFRVKGLAPRLNTMNGLLLLASQMDGDKFLPPDESEMFDDAEAEKKEEKKVKDTGPIDVWHYRGDKWSKLSNLAQRPFKNKGKYYYSVEHAYQSWKSGKFDEETFNKYKSGDQKIAGRMGTKTDDNWNIKMMKKVIRESMKQNPKIIKLLLRTGDREITHVNDKGIWKTEFPRILMELREEFRNTPDDDKTNEPKDPKGPEAPNKENKVKKENKSFRVGITEAGDAGMNKSWLAKADKYSLIVAITKSPSRLLDVEIPDNTIIHCSITGQGGTKIEPNVKPWTEEIEAYHKLVAKYGKDRVVLRIDPIFCTKKGLARAKEVFEHAEGRVRVSYMDMYPHVKERFAAAGITVPKEHMGFHAPADIRMEASKMFPGAEACGEPGLTAKGCVSKDDLVAIGLDENLATGKSNQRHACLCIAAKEELLPRVNRPCAHGCLYCYWKGDLPK
jgi:predicted NAD-dependent protein-ADP-ribosyltransferase YbiA (DUF1768 family)